MTNAEYKLFADALKASSLEALLKENSFSFGPLLRLMIEDSPVKARVVYEKLEITKTYFYDILKSKSKPPPPDKQFEIIRLLHPSPAVAAAFFDAAAKERGEFPADLQKHIDENNLFGALRAQYKLNE